MIFGIILTVCTDSVRAIWCSLAFGWTHCPFGKNALMRVLDHQLFKLIRFITIQITLTFSTSALVIECSWRHFLYILSKSTFDFSISSSSFLPGNTAFRSACKSAYLNSSLPVHFCSFRSKCDILPFKIVTSRLILTGLFSWWLPLWL